MAIYLSEATQSQMFPSEKTYVNNAYHLLSYIIPGINQCGQFHIDTFYQNKIRIWPHWITIINICVLHSKNYACHYISVIMGMMVSQINSFTIVYSTVYLGADQRIHQSSVSLALVRGIHRRPREMFLFDDVITMQFAHVVFCCSLHWYIIFYRFTALALSQ